MNDVNRPISLSASMGRIRPSATVGISQMARQLTAEGRNIIALSAGEPDFDTPEPIKQAAKRALDAGKTKYTNIEGIAELREAVADKFRRENGLDVVAQDCFVASGGKQIIFNALMATLDPGDEVVVPVPYWVSYPDIVRLAGAKPVFVTGGADAGFKITGEKLRAALTERTRWLILNSPSNPTGAAYGADELAALGAVLRDFPGVLVLSDDIYEHLLYDGLKFVTLAQVCQDLANRVVTLNGVSKAYSMTGWRIGYCAAPAGLLKGMSKLQGQSTTNACSISQWAALEALNGSQAFLGEWREVFQKRRDMVVAGLNNIAGINCLVPNGAFYVFPKITDLLGKTSAGGKRIDSDEDFVMALLGEQGVALVHGEAFGLPGYFRLSYAASQTSLTEAIKRIGEFCAKLV